VVPEDSTCFGITRLESSKKRRVTLMEMRRGEGIWVDLGEVTESPSPYTMSYGFNLDLLCESIRKVGVLNPPLVSRDEKGSFDVAAGYRRIRRRLLWESPALVKT
jgi:hypothetical protein